MTTAQRPFVSIVIPALNEANYIAAAIESLKPLSTEFEWELLILDGGSSDKTREIVLEFASKDVRIKLIPNPKRIQSAAMNLAARIAEPRARFLVRADCHAAYPEGFVARCIEALDRTGAASVVVPMITEGKTCVQKAIAAAQNSKLGNGGAAHRGRARSCYVDHGHHAAFRRHAFSELGGYDETFGHNEDAEFDRRLRATGQRIFLQADLPIRYFPRATLSSLARQYRNYGWGCASTLLKHKAQPKLRQLLPVAALLGSIAGLASGAVFSARFIGLPLLYIGLCATWGVALAVQHRDRCLLASGPAAIVMHMNWAVGFLWRIGAQGWNWLQEKLAFFREGSGKRYQRIVS